MTNKEGEILLKASFKIFKRDVKSALEDRDYNMVIRRAQESVELALKGMLKILGFEYPKIHHVGDVFKEKIQEKGIRIEKDVLDEIEEISLRLAQAREASFYFEKVFGRKEAKKAYEDAKYVLDIIKKLKRKIFKEK